MPRSVTAILLVLAAVAVTACGGSDSDSDNGLARLEGRIVWEDGGALPSGSTVSVQIVNASLADANDTLTQAAYETEGQPPIDFFMEYDESRVDERVTYTATIRIEDPDGSLVYITKTSQPVIVNGEVVDDIEIVVEPV